MTQVKICGITTPDALDAAVTAGAHYLGFVFHSASPRNLTLDRAKSLTNKTPSNLMNVGLFVNPRPSEIARVLEEADLDMIQLHGNEPPSAVQTIRGQFGLPVIKAIRVATADDVKAASSYEKVTDWLLFDAKSAAAQGGTGESFDWALLKDYRPLKPWMLAGGLTPENVGAALSQLKPNAVDVSSGVEDAPGQKDPEKIRLFIEAVKAAT